MPKLIVCDKYEDVSEEFIPVKYPEDIQSVLDEGQDGVYAVEAPDKTWALYVPNLKRFPNWEFVRVIKKSSLPLIKQRAADCAKALPNYSILEAKDVITESKPVFVSKPVALPERILILADNAYAYQLKGTLLTSTGKSFRTAGRNPFVYKAKDVHKARKSKRDIVLVEVDSFKGWDVPDLLDEFKVVVFSEDEVALPGCEGLPGYFELDSEALDNDEILDKLYSFLDLVRE